MRNLQNRYKDIDTGSKSNVCIYLAFADVTIFPSSLSVSVYPQITIHLKYTSHPYIPYPHLQGANLTFLCVLADAALGNDVDCKAERRCHKVAPRLCDDANIPLGWEVLVQRLVQHCRDLKQLKHSNTVSKTKPATGMAD